MAGCSANHAKNIVNSYIHTVETQRRSIKKNFEQMEIRNANICENLNEIKEDMLKSCDNLIRDLEDYRCRIR